MNAGQYTVWGLVRFSAFFSPLPHSLCLRCCFPFSRDLTASVMLGGQHRPTVSPAQRTQTNAVSSLHLVQNTHSVSTHKAPSTVGPAQKVLSRGHMRGSECHTDKVPESISLFHWWMKRSFFQRCPNLPACPTQEHLTARAGSWSWRFATECASVQL